jgi:hypothetical protein
MSKDGQQLLTQPQLSRLPILPPDQLKMPPGYPNALEIAKKAKVKFDPDLSANRYNVVASLFDQTITFRHRELTAATRAIQTAEAALAKKPNPAAAALVAQARELAFKPLVNAGLAADPAFLATFAADKKNSEANKQVTGREGEWSGKAQDNYQKAKALAEQAVGLVQ